MNHLRQAISSVSRSLTALGNSANVMFAQLSATLAMDRAAASFNDTFGIKSRQFVPSMSIYQPFGALSALQATMLAPFGSKAISNPTAFALSPINFYASFMAAMFGTSCR